MCVRSIQISLIFVWFGSSLTLQFNPSVTPAQGNSSLDTCSACYKGICADPDYLPRNSDGKILDDIVDLLYPGLFRTEEEIKRAYNISEGMSYHHIFTVFLSIYNILSD